VSDGGEPAKDDPDNDLRGAEFAQSCDEEFYLMLPRGDICGEWRGAFLRRHVGAARGMEAAMK
jgi:hypothetical protein